MFGEHNYPILQAWKIILSHFWRIFAGNETCSYKTKLVMLNLYTHLPQLISLISAAAWWAPLTSACDHVVSSLGRSTRNRWHSTPFLVPVLVLNVSSAPATLFPVGPEWTNLEINDNNYFSRVSYRLEFDHIWNGSLCCITIQ